jgi:hypothetical protein
MTRLCAMAFAAVFSAQPLPQADGPLEPSVQNEVDHAIDLGERWLEKTFKADKASKVDKDLTDTKNPKCLKTLEDLGALLGLTNGQTRVEMAMKLVSSQRGGGWWLTDTNAAPTRLAVEILKGL